MIRQGSDSVAARLHYPDSAKKSKTEGAVQFYCEVGSDGRARHVRAIAESSWSALRFVVRDAVQKGRFVPARVGGRPTAVMIGGTVFFLMPNGQPTILVTMATADKTKAAAGRNYIQPQMLRSFDDLERKMYTWRSLVTQYSAYPSAEVICNVDANGNLTGTKIVGESKANGGLGAVAVKACEGAKFVPAMDNGETRSGTVQPGNRLCHVGKSRRAGVRLTS
ncbi:MAG: energy transducer TonB [Verrucomicrobia bacterium]|nr:energy transducer TonB [Verrucomicrobiota bacterium]